MRKREAHGLDAPADLVYLIFHLIIKLLSKEIYLN